MFLIEGVENTKVLGGQRLERVMSLPQRKQKTDDEHRGIAGKI